ncbi:RAMP superfamily CRISPR-associated protein [Clostridium oryzae]|uniref:CRISPR type III-associated protein domain-containing protein n=1 Tax=Clostridium oryzae TaxID=1450648 RepID=A0A1V4IRW3_9CLOT|nr:RAMP superfamily CRISPR-associated protein [Clostridium oryzae]OPJ62768.1 hypothetical protein CLORY_16480 [Clostridium oryzae]
MKKAEIEIKIITPMFSYGNRDKKLSKEKENVEFRITELKSLIRSTFRELGCFKDLQSMKVEEGKTFGTILKIPEVDSRGIKSPISFRIKEIKIDEISEYMLPHKTEEKDRSKRPCVKEESIVKLLMTCKDNIDMYFYIKLLIQASILGGLGGRSRKGFGSFTVTDVKCEKEAYNLLEKSTLEILLQLNNEDIFEFNAVKGKLKRKGEGLKYPYIKAIQVIPFNDGSNYKVLLKEISQLTHDRLKDDFGFYADKKIRERDTVKSYKGENQRFAFPVCVSFSEYAREKCMVIKELNYDYIMKSLDKTQKENVRVYNEKYVQAYIEKLIEIVKGKTK